MSMASGGICQEWFSAAELAELRLPGLPSTKRGVQQQAEREGWAKAECEPRGRLARPRRGRGGGTEYHLNVLPEAARRRLLAGDKAKTERPDREAVWTRWERLPESVRQEGLRRLSVLEQVEGLRARGMTLSAAVAETVQQAAREARLQGQEPPFSESTVWGWRNRIVGVRRDDRAAYLAPDYQGRTTTAEIPEEAWAAYKREYLRPEKPTRAHCYRLVSDIARQQGWSLPSAKTFERRLAAEIGVDQQILMREGTEAFKHCFGPVQRKRPDYPLQVVNLDAHVWDVFVLFEGQDKPARPVTVAIQDLHSGMPLAVRVDATLSHHTVRLALGDCLRDYGVPERLIMDNGRENQAKAISGQIPRFRKKAVDEEPAGLLKILGIEAVFAAPYHGQAKPIERMFRDWAHDIAKHPAFEGCYVGNKPDAKPENYQSKAIPVAEFERVLRQEIARYADQLGRRGLGMNGRSFRQVFQEGIASRPARRLTETQLRLCMLAAAPQTMERRSGAVRVLGNYYWCPELAALPRQKVVVRFDPADLSKPVYVYDLRDRLLCEVPRHLEGDFTSVEKALEVTRARTRYRRTRKAAVEAERAYLGSVERNATSLDRLAQAHAEVAAPPPAPADGSNVIRADFAAPSKPERLRSASTDFEEAWARGVAATQDRR